MITPEMSIAEVMRMDPEVAPVFMSYGMHCLYCPHASAESIAEASLVHGIVFRRQREQVIFPKSSTRRVFDCAAGVFYPFPAHKSVRRT